MKQAVWISGMCAFVALLAWVAKWVELGHVHAPTTALVFGLCVVRVWLGILYARDIDRRLAANEAEMRARGMTP